MFIIFTRTLLSGRSVGTSRRGADTGRTTGLIHREAAKGERSVPRVAEVFRTREGKKGDVL